MRRGAFLCGIALALALSCGEGTEKSRGVQRDAGASDATSVPHATGDAGASGAGGSPANGGSGAGGSPASGGSGAGGSPASGGRGVGGSPASGGSPSAGGAANAGGASSDAGASVTYSTNFDVAESPLSEGGAWHHDGLDWTRVDAENGIALGTQLLGVTRSGPTAYDDSYAYLSGFPPDQQATAHVHLGTIDGGCTHEVEIILRWADSAHVARGYECNFAWDGAYAQIVRWNGPVGDYTYLANGSVPGGMHEGDSVTASIVGTEITLSVNGVVRATAQDATFATGDPGIAFWRGMSGCGTRGDYGFDDFSASSVP